MKKVKVMMTAIGILAVVGGALAFKARTYSAAFCTRANNAGICQGSYIGKTSTNQGQTFYTTPTDDPLLCTNGVITCPTSVRLTTQEP
jgi:hypothetical protein